MVKTLLGIILSITITNSPVVTINTLIEQSLTHDHQTVVIEGEVLGEVLERGDHAWLNVNDGTNAIGIYLKLDQTSGLKYFGDYFNQGDIVSTINYEQKADRYGTQGGGVVVYDRLCLGYRFVEAPPNQTELEVGDIMPEEWSVGGRLKE